ncbi:ABC transporter ATP-binding protein [Sphingomicrobium astaxanthinifaciens]|uniref:ABC transporter ATP-binding protein n=1 Tax=Sphingomicrobium astaxanthinifaciens TaxID=1227949 RepID=UPI001FCBC207|nr:ATP-binding cassette domain-containing protein [Sphingomicrobium astaxanthinifaciens]MCJ7420789.1 ATP-binding cassette domain-containing protein [Sphingomicrobium astaxanthinifaciens]
MIGFENAHKYHHGEYETKVVLYDVTFLFEPSDHVAVLAEGGAGKSTLVNLLSGLDQPTKGTVHRDADMSWPLGFAGPFHPAMTGEENVRTIAALADHDPDEIAAYVRLFTELGHHFFEPVQTYSSTMRALLAFATSMAIPAQVYLSDEKVAVGEGDMRAKCEAALRRKIRDAGLFLVTRNARIAQSFADKFAVLRHGRIIACRDFEDARALFEDTTSRLDEIADIMSGFHTA